MLHYNYTTSESALKEVARLSIEWTIYVLASTGAGILTLAVAVYSWHKIPALGAKMIVVIASASSLWAFCNVLQVMTVDLSTMIFWDSVKTIGIIIIPVAWIALSLEYSGYERFLNRRFWILVSIEPIISVFFMCTNHLYGLVYQFPRIETSGPFPHIEYNFGPGMFVDIAFGYFLLGIGAILIIWKQLHMSRFYYAQTAAILTSMILPLISHLIWFANVLPFPALDLTPIFFSGSALLFTWAVFSQGLLGIVPVALNVAVKSMNDGLIVLDDEDRVVYLNPAMENIFGQITSEIRGHPIDRLLNEWPELKSYALSGESGRMEILWDRKLSSSYYEVHSAVLLENNDEMVGKLFVLHDITSLRQAQDELQQQASELRAQNEELDAYGHTVAHGLKNILQIILSKSGLMMLSHNSMSTKELEMGLEQVESAATKMSGIIENLMHLGGLRNEVVKLENLDISSIINEVIGRLESMIDEYQAEIILPSSWPLVVGYAPWIEEVWENYISNAMKYGGHPCIVEIGSTEVDDNMILFWVNDNGNGIPEENKSLIFSPIVNRDFDGFKSHGLGLSIVERIVKRLGGSTGFESSIGKGSTFTFTLPSTTILDNEN